MEGEDKDNVQERAARYISELRSRDKHVRERAFDLLKEIGPDAILDQVIKVHRCDQEAHKGTFRNRNIVITLGSGAAGYLIFSALATCETNPYGGIPAMFFGVLCGLFAAVVLATVKPSAGDQYRRQSLLRLLCASEDPQVVGPLCDYLQSSALRKRDTDLKSVVFGALAKLLPRVQIDTPNLLGAQQRMTLRRELSLFTPYSTYFERKLLSDVAIGYMQCMANLGDTSAIPEIERQQRVYSRLPDGHNTARLAQECLDVLRGIQEADRQGKALLRGSESPAQAAAELLREAKSPESDPDELLRPEE